MILVFGKNGQVATALRHEIPEAKYISSQEANFLDVRSLLSVLDQYKPSIVINAAAYTQVDKAESEQQECMQINAVAPGKIARWCQQNQAILYHYSTDYVFNGKGTLPWNESDIPDPINFYGKSKLEGEQLIQESGCKHYIFRISWVYSDWGANFKKTILRLAKERTELKIVNDQWGSPTNAQDIARRTSQWISKDSSRPFGIYHFRFSPYTTWYHFACQIVAEARARGEQLKVERILPIATEEFPTPAKRPKNSRLTSLYLNEGT